MPADFDFTPNAATIPVFFLIVFLRYLFFSGGAYWLFYRKKRTAWWHRKILQRLPPSHLLWREFLWSICTCLIFAAAGTGMLYLWVKGGTRIYLDIHEWGLFYFVFSIVALLLLHEVYFYWTHRWLHLPWLFKKVHYVHHESINPSPWAAFSFHPMEALIQAAILPLLVCVVPVHPLALGIFLMVMTVTAVINHNGFEVYPSGMAEHWLGKWVIGATHHFQHHSRFHCNFGLYFTFLDHLHGTEYGGYAELYNEVKNRPLMRPAET